MSDPRFRGRKLTYPLQDIPCHRHPPQPKKASMAVQNSCEENIMKTLRLGFSLILLGLTAPWLAAAPAAGKYLRSEAFDVSSLIPPAPADNSLTTAADVTTLLEVQKRRTPEAIAFAAFIADHYSAFQFDTVIGEWFTPENLPVSAAIFAQIAEDRYAISSKGKKIWQRPRPPLLDPRIHACIHLPHSDSYPSGHATMAYVWADLLAEMFPEKRDALRERAELIAWTRVIGGVHYPSDITAGRMLGDRLAQEFLKIPALQAALQDIRQEAARAAAVSSGAKPAPSPGAGLR